MKKFNFKFETLLKVEKIKEKKLKQIITNIDMEIKKRELEIKELLIKADNISKRESDKLGRYVPVLDIRGEREYVKELYIESTKLEKEILLLDEKKQNEINKLIKTTKKIKKLEENKDIDKQQYKVMIEKEEEKEINEFISR